MKTTITVASTRGEFVNLLEPRWQTISPQAMCESLSILPRFNAHVYVPGRQRCWSLAEHSLFVEFILRVLFPGRSEMTYLGGKVHDFHEYVCADILTPVASAISWLSGDHSGRKNPAITQLKNKIQRAIMERLGAMDVWDHLQKNPEEDMLVHYADKLAYVFESIGFRPFWKQNAEAVTLYERFQRACQRWADKQTSVTPFSAWLDSEGFFSFYMPEQATTIMDVFKADLLNCFPALSAVPGEGEADLRWDADTLGDERNFTILANNAEEVENCRRLSAIIDQYQVQKPTMTKTPAFSV